MELNLSNPKRFLPLLLFIGFVFTLMGKGWESYTADSGMYSMGILLLFAAIVLWIFRNKM